ncbi:hypothetical protein ACFQJC_06705 [Haloferax namakaokahaiae]|uniref:DUF2382 domain-containing protein n=1 Tax=Haloferax namakaokahaiae TaxID=1748331 RepID=A0ABD5ZE79_9EURY
MSNSEFTTDPQRIEQWANEHERVPVRRGGHPELVTRSETTDTDESLDWETFYREIENEDKVVIRHRDSDGVPYFEVADRRTTLEQMETEAGYEHEEIESRFIEGETIEGTITETTVVSTTVVEEATLESEVVDRNVIDRRVANVELRQRTCSNCDVVGATEDVDRVSDDDVHYQHDYGDENRFLVGDDDAMSGEVEEYDGYPFDLTAEVEEEWGVTIEERERFTIETRIKDVDVFETDTVDAHDLEANIDVESVHDQILREERFNDTTSEQTSINTETHHIESEFVEDDVIVTYLTIDRVIDQDVSERRQLTAKVVSGKMLSRTTSDESVRETRLTEREATGGVEETATDEMTDETMDELRVVPERRDEGKPVIVAPDRKIGIVASVRDRIAYVESDPGFTDRIAAKLGFGGVDEDDLQIDEHRIERITDDEVFLTADYDEDVTDEARA